MRNILIAFLLGILVGGIFFGSTVGRAYMTTWAQKIGVDLGNSLLDIEECPKDFACYPQDRFELPAPCPEGFELHAQVERCYPVASPSNTPTN